MFDQLTRVPRAVVRSAMAHAHALGAQVIEPEHLLAALGAPQSAVGGVLDQFGLGADRVRELIVAERARSLSAAGITVDPPAPSSGELALSTPAKAVLRRAAAASHRRIDEAHLLLALLEPKNGTLPRLLRLAGVDRAQLRAAVTDEGAL